MAQVKRIRIEDVHVPLRHRRKAKPDDALAASVRDVGVKFPILVVQNGSRYILADGGQRLKLLKAMDKKTIEAVVHTTDRKPEEYARHIRVVVNHHRQGFYPSQRAHYLRIHMKKFGITVEEMALALGKNQKTVRSWLSVADCSEEIQMLINNNTWPVKSAHLLSTLTQEGQQKVLDHFRGRDRVLFDELQARIQKAAAAEGARVTPRRVRRVGQNQWGGRRRTVREDALRGQSLPDVVKSTVDVQKEIDYMRKQVLAAEPVVRAIMKSRAVRKMVGHQHLVKFEQFLGV